MQKNPNLINNARSLRKNMTEAEKKLWYTFLRRYPVRFQKQYVIEGYILDFYCPPIKLGIELDGGQHYEEEMMLKDNERTRKLEQTGVSVLRYTNVDVLQHFEAVCERIDREAEARLMKK